MLSIRQLILTVFKISGSLVLVFVVLTVFMGIYSVTWMSPKADGARKQFEKMIRAGATTEIISQVASELGADEIRTYDIQSPESGAVKRMSVRFFRFPGGLSRHTCVMPIVQNRAISVACHYSG
jgi:hypothetical protein